MTDTTQPPAETLGPCPFCKWTAPDLTPIRDGRVVRCPNCGARGAPCFHGRADQPSAADRAVAAWNAAALTRRAGDDAIPAGEVTGVTLYREVDALGGARNEDGEYNAGWSDGHSRALDDVLEILTKRGFTEAADDNQRYRGWVIEKAFTGWSFNHPDYDPDNAADQRYGSAASIVEARDEIDRLLSDASEAEVIARCAEIVKARASEFRRMANPVGHPFHGGIIDGIFDRQANALEAAAADILAMGEPA